TRCSVSAWRLRSSPSTTSGSTAYAIRTRERSPHRDGGVTPDDTMASPSPAPPPVPRAAPQQERSRATVEKILAAADHEFAARGSTGVTTTQIADRAGVSVGALYRFFPDKQAIAAALAERY